MALSEVKGILRSNLSKRFEHRGGYSHTVKIIETYIILGIILALTGLQLRGLSSLPRMIQWLLDYLGFIPQQSRDEIIRLRHTAGETLSDLARTFGISRSAYIKSSTMDYKRPTLVNPEQNVRYATSSRREALALDSPVSFPAYT